MAKQKGVQQNVFLRDEDLAKLKVLQEKYGFNSISKTVRFIIRTVYSQVFLGREYEEDEK